MLNKYWNYGYAIECECYQLGQHKNNTVTKIVKWWENEREYENANVLIFQSSKSTEFKIER